MKRILSATQALMFAAGLALVTVGVGMWSRPAGLVTLGASLVTLSVVGALRGGGA